MPKAEYTYALDDENNLYACFGRTVKYKYSQNKWEEVENPDDFEFLFEVFSPTKIISSQEALKLTKQKKPIAHFTVNKRVYLTEKEIDHELSDFIKNRNYSEDTGKLVLESSLDMKILVLEWLIKNPNLHELTIRILIQNF